MTHDWRRPGAPGPHVLLPIVLAATFMAQFDLYVVNVALPVLQRDLSATDAQLQLFVGGYAFTYAAGLITGGRLGDIMGHRRMFMVGMSGFGVASFLCGTSPSASALVWFRLLQGLTAAAMVPQVLAIITASFGPAERQKALSWFGVTIGVGAVAGQVIGGLLLQANLFDLGWRTIFYVNVPIAVVTVALAHRHLPALKPNAQVTLDLAGAVGVTASLGLTLFPLIVGRAQSWPWWSWTMLAISAPAMVCVLLWEARLQRSGGTPILPLRLFTETPFNIGLLLSVVLFSAFFSFVFCLTLILQDGIGLSPLHAGFTFGPLGVGFAVASIAARPYVQRYGAKVICAGSSVVTLALAATVALLAIKSGRVSAIELVGPMTVVGIGNGVAVPTVIGQVLSRIQPTNAGAAAGVLSTAQQFSSAVGIAAIGGVFFAVLGSSDRRSDYSRALLITTTCDLALAIAGVALSVALIRIAKPITS